MVLNKPVVFRYNLTPQWSFDTIACWHCEVLQFASLPRFGML